MSRVLPTKFPAIWERLDETTFRKKVFGGWLVHSCISESSESMCFVPDPKHDWKIIEPEQK